MLVIRHDLSYHRPLSERMIVSFPQLLLETTAAELLSQTAPSRRKNAARLDKPQVYTGHGDNNKIDLEKMAQNGWQDLCWNAVIKVPAGLDTTLINPKTGAYCLETEPRIYDVLISLEDAMPKFIWPAFAEGYREVATDLATGSHIDIGNMSTAYRSRRPIPTATATLCDVPPEDWLTAINRYIPTGKSTGPSRWSQNTFSDPVLQAFRNCDIRVSCTALSDNKGCSWFDGQAAKAGVDWVDRGHKPKNNSRYASLIDTRAGQRLSSHKGSMTSQALANDETMWRDRPDEIIDPANANPGQRSHVITSRPIGSKERGGYRLPDGRFVTNTGMVYNDEGEVVAYANGDKFTPIEYDPNTKEVEPCIHVTRTLMNFLEDGYQVPRMIGQAIGSCLWTWDGRNRPAGMVNAWKAWAKGEGASLCTGIYNELSQYT